MLFRTVLVVLPCFVASISGAPRHKAGPNAPCLERLFTGTFQIAAPLKPIPIEGGVRVGECFGFLCSLFRTALLWEELLFVVGGC